MSKPWNSKQSASHRWRERETVFQFADGGAIRSVTGFCVCGWSAKLCGVWRYENEARQEFAQLFNAHLLEASRPDVWRP